MTYFPECLPKLRLRRPNVNIFPLLNIFNNDNHCLMVERLMSFQWILILFFTKSPYYGIRPADACSPHRLYNNSWGWACWISTLKTPQSAKVKATFDGTCFDVPLRTCRFQPLALVTRCDGRRRFISGGSANGDKTASAHDWTDMQPTWRTNHVTQRCDGQPTVNKLTCEDDPQWLIACSLPHIKYTAVIGWNGFYKTCKPLHAWFQH